MMKLKVNRWPIFNMSHVLIQLHLEELEKEVKECLISMAVFIGKTRLIDNIILGK